MGGANSRLGAYSNKYVIYIIILFYKLLLLLLSLSLSSQSLLVFFLYTWSAGRKPCTLSVSHSSQSFCSYTEHLSEDSRRSQLADRLNLRHSSSLWYFLDVFYHTLLFRLSSVPHIYTTKSRFEVVRYSEKWKLTALFDIQVMSSDIQIMSKIK